MQIIPLYKYIRPDGGTTVSSTKPECEYTELYRLIADDDKVLVNGNVITACTDVSTTEGWTEAEPPEGWGEEEYLEQNVMRDEIAEEIITEVMGILTGEVNA